MAELTREDILAGLRALGVRQGMELEVHSSLSSFGRVAGGADAVIDALEQAVGADGTLYMPALRLSPELELTDEDRRMGILRKIKVLEPDAGRTAMGLIADTFRRRTDVTTGEGTFAISGWGRYADEAARGGLTHPLHGGGWGLLLGVDIYKLTAMHYVEDALPAEISAIFAPPPEVSAVYPPDEWFIETGEPPVKPWYTIWDRARARGLIREGGIGPCRCALFRLWDVAGIYRRALLEEPRRLYGLKD